MLTELQTKKLTRYFRVYDVDDDGRIGAGDFERVLENVRMLHGLDERSPDQDALRRSFTRRWESLRASADTDDDGGVDISEWLRYWGAVISQDEEYEEVVTALVARLFEAFDTDEDGRLGPDEYCNFFAVYGLSADLARSMFARLDLNGDGTISHDELMGHVHAFYRGDDPGAAGNLLFGPYD
jgi:Ca2+-binding EF-hand superfamily protein